jgi:hypothetical protein
MKNLKTIIYIIIISTIFIQNLKAESLTSKFNQSIIKDIKENYQYRIPLYLDDLISLIGVFSPNQNKIVLEYLIDYNEIKTQIEEYNLTAKNKIKNIDKYLFSEKVIKQFKKDKIAKHINKCFMTKNGKNYFSQNLVMTFRYYLKDKFYTEFSLNKKICSNIRY